MDIGGVGYRENILTMEGKFDISYTEIRCYKKCV